MVAWKNKPAAQQTWAKLQTYFTEKWLERKQYSTTMAKQWCFKEAVLLAQETAAAEEEGKSQAMLFAMLQEQHDRQTVAMTATKQGQHGHHDGKDARTGDRWSRKMPNPSRQGEHPHCREQPPHINGIRSNPAQETREAQVHVSLLQNVCSSQTQKLCWTKGKQGKCWPGWKLVHTIA